jgi:hypothetical protein
LWNCIHQRCISKTFLKNVVELHSTTWRIKSILKSVQDTNHVCRQERQSTQGSMSTKQQGATQIMVRLTARQDAYQLNLRIPAMMHHSPATVHAAAAAPSPAASTAAAPEETCTRNQAVLQ